jgi:hypothetical protein
LLAVVVAALLQALKKVAVVVVLVGIEHLPGHRAVALLPNPL